MERNPTHSMKDLCKMILACSSYETLDTVRNLLMKDLYTYSIADQGFLLTMVGIQIIKLGDGNRKFDLFLRDCLLRSSVISTDN